MAGSKTTDSKVTTSKATEKVANLVVTSQEPRGQRKRQDGVVVSNKMEKTVVVAVVRQVKHALYGKFIRKTKKFYAHDETKQCGVGDRVRIVETRPLSKLKNWKIESILNKAD
ncbi:MAG: 30S ribosomal protein S17 [Proteobacteria bacterium]|nr:30S ribosomal protein S17 [Pseudomonadota bacterium]